MSQQLKIQQDLESARQKLLFSIGVRQNGQKRLSEDGVAPYYDQELEDDVKMLAFIEHAIEMSQKK